ncbi:alpha/beta hydrolase [Yersinia massiliensis]|jgi:alpha-beta hydrolase superfamily lysophospholipase|uniref:Alpha/beta hydrolase n=2 Tax=Yersinia TaxID=629 RepID=A0A2R4NVL9_9GAMM|nr:MULTISPECIES: alpha/beta hydrolase [Yersinia]HEC1651670.1 alpha/beta hydrolase [Yersinia enterocolitica]ATM88080.1 alpha/beta hydrolase [Yersinia frederiksenii]AVX40181.1 alpha/beta hydrolase [Yersinia massiliensis]MCB5318953.1 alpha/beta hydrolase [Yersinia massiliensis]MDA5548713.1 alpha/beta hydrolase [Yersinia massiliensis]
MLSIAIKRWIKRIILVLVVISVTILAIRIYDTQRGPKLELWHTFVPHEMRAAEIDKASWADYMKAENNIFDEVRKNVTEKLEPRTEIPLNRYYSGSSIYPPSFKNDWNRSYILQPDGKPKGAVVLLHGLTDTPYSLRHIAENYRQRGYVAIGIRLPAHGSVPGALTDVEWQDWLAATRLAVREAKTLSGPDLPLHVVGFSNGGALAMKYTLDSLDDPALAKPERVILISPMIGVTSFARFAGIAGWPAIFPAFAKAAWLGIVPEFNPFKYNSFPVNAARQSYLLTSVLQQQIARDSRNNKMEELPPILTFQSLMDSTVSTRAVVTALYNHLPKNGSEVVLFDLNRAASFGPLLRNSSYTALARLLPPPPRNYSTTVITNVSPQSNETVAITTLAGQTNETTVPTGLIYPPDIFSLSHVALPFPMSDSLYGRYPEPRDQYGISLGTFAARGERAVLVVGLDSLMRISSNPFYPYMLQRIDDKIDAPAQ